MFVLFCFDFRSYLFLGSFGMFMLGSSSFMLNFGGGCFFIGSKLPGSSNKGIGWGMYGFSIFSRIQCRSSAIC